MRSSYLLFVVCSCVITSSEEQSCSSQQVQCEDGGCVESAFLCDGIPDCTDESDERQEMCQWNRLIQMEFNVRLTEGERGRLELRYGGVWGTVCDTGFGNSEATVVCRLIGQTGGHMISNSPYAVKPDRHLPIWLDRISCGGWETTLDECSHSDWGHAFCSHASDVAIQCGTIMQTRRNCPGCFPGSSMILPAPSTKTPATTFSSAVSVQGKKNPTQNIETDGSASCKRLRRKKRITGGRIIQLEETPWQGSIRLRSGADGSHLCGAIILNSNTVLTAAHCVHLKPTVVLRVRVGDWNANVTEEEEQEFKVNQVVVHPQYYNNGRPFNDLAILKLKQNQGRGIQFGTTVEAACLPRGDDIYKAGTQCTVTGWGQTNSTHNIATNILRAADIPILSDSECSLRDVLRDNVPEGMFCAGFLSDSQKDACYGDSGGALTCTVQGTAVVAGMTSWGIECADANKPGVYVKLTHYLQWINSHMQDI